jgi:hypothetical protein
MATIKAEMTDKEEKSSSVSANHLYDKWVIWAHLPHDTDWTIGSYKRIATLTTIENSISVYKVIPEKLVKNCMLFLMRDGISPTWEDDRNRQGGCFSFKVSNNSVFTTWRNLSYILIGETLSSNQKMLKLINGITISPKRSFCIVKIWMADCSIQSPSKLSVVPGLSTHGCLFKRHKPVF